MAFPTLLPALALTDPPFTATPTWTALSQAKLREAEIDRGRSWEGESFSPGTYKAVYDNRDRAFDKFYASGSFYGNLNPSKGTRLRCLTATGNTYPLFRGFVRGFPQRYKLGGDQVVETNADEIFALLARAPLTAGGLRPEEPSNDRFVAIRTAAGLPAGLTSISSVGASVCIAEDISGLKAMEAFTEIDNTEHGLIFPAKAGFIAFYSRDDLVTQSQFTTPQAVFGDARDGVEIPYRDLDLDDDVSKIRNEIKVTHPYFEEVVREDATSKTDHGPLGHDVECIDASPAAMRSTAEALLDLFKDPKQRVKTIEIPLHLEDADYPDGLYDLVLPLELGQRVSLKHQPTGGGSRIEVDFWIDHISHSIKADERTWITTLQLGLCRDGVSYGLWDTAEWDSAEWAW